jgi:hypothetical protein
MLVLANEIFNSPPVFTWVLPVFVRLQPRKEERVLDIVGEVLLNNRPHPTLTPWLPSKPTLLQGIFFYVSEDLHGGVAARENKEGDPPGFHRRLYYSTRGWKVERVTVVNGLPTTGATLPQTKFCRALSSCRTKNALVRIC